jgi:Ser-tRNA(Ala) deacylase AlaX
MKKNNYNWNLNPEKLSKAQIDAHMDFDKVLKEYNNTVPEVPKKTSLFRRLRYIGAVAATALVCLLVYVGVNSAKNNNSATDFQAYAATQPYINPPLDGTLAEQFVNKTVNANVGGVFEFENGSKFTVPPAAFTHGQGGIVQGEVQIRFREFHDYVDFFLSGIPMEYDSAGVQYHLESAGMVEIIAEQNGQPLKMAMDKSIEVELVSNVILDENGQVPSFNIYYLDTEKRNWVYEGIDKIKRVDEPIENASFLLAEEEQLENNFQQTIAQIQSKPQTQFAAIEKALPALLAPVKPQKANGSVEVFDFAFEEDQIDYGSKVPGTTEESLRMAEEQVRNLRKQYANTMWQFSPNNKNITEAQKLAIKKMEWEDMSLKFVGGQDYELTLIGDNNNLTFLINPVLTGANYEKALTEFNAQQSRYEAEITERQTFLKAKKAELKAAADEEERIAALAHEEKVAAYRANGMAHRATDEIIKAKIVNQFSITQLGVWNCDRPLPIGMLALNGNFKGSANEEYHQNIAYLVDKDRNTLVRFFTKEGARMDITLGSKNLLWLITKDNQLAICPPSHFDTLKNKKTSPTDRVSHTFVLDLIDKPFNSEEDIRKILEL